MIESPGQRIILECVQRQEESPENEIPYKELIFDILCRLRELHNLNPFVALG